MAGKEGEFEPRLGRMRGSRSPRSGKYLHRVIAAAALAGGMRRRGGRAFTGGKSRGAPAGLLLGSGRFAGSRRAIVKARLVRIGGKGLAAARAHLRYIQREGVQRDGSPGELYSAGEDRADGRDFLERCGGDRHQFRFIVSAEDGDQYDDLKPLVRRWMARMEEDLGTRLDWVAVDHRDTAHPHSHVMLRGKDDRGENLVIARDYVARGMRERLAQLVTLDLGPSTVIDVARRLRLEVDAERFTGLDRELVRESGIHAVLAAAHRDPHRHALRTGRLKKLEALGLAENLGGGTWRLDAKLEERLRALGERGDIVRTMQRALRSAGLDRGSSERVIHSAGLGRPLTGRVVERGLSDEVADRHYLIVDGVDGRVHHVGIGRDAEPLPEGSIVRISPITARGREADRTIVEIAGRNAGLYSPQAHFRHDPSATEEFAKAHVRRLEAIRRAAGGLERNADGSWSIPPDFLDLAARHEASVTRSNPVAVELLSAVPLDVLPNSDGATWLDRQLASREGEQLRDAGFGREVRRALALRGAWLLNEGLANEAGGDLQLAPGALSKLRGREIGRVAGELSRSTGKAYFDAPSGARINGIARRRLDLASGRFVMVENEREFSLVPWRPVLERALGRQVSGMARSGGPISWAIGRGRGVEI